MHSCVPSYLVRARISVFLRNFSSQSGAPMHREDGGKDILDYVPSDYGSGARACVCALVVQWRITATAAAARAEAEETQQHGQTRRWRIEQWRRQQRRQRKRSVAVATDALRRFPRIHIAWSTSICMGVYDLCVRTI